MNVFDTGRLHLRWLTLDDAPFIFRLVNDPSWLRFIGDRGVRTEEDARGFLQKGPLAMYQRRGFGLYHVALKESAMPIGFAFEQRISLTAGEPEVNLYACKM